MNLKTPSRPVALATSMLVLLTPLMAGGGAADPIEVAKGALLPFDLTTSTDAPGAVAAGSNFAFVATLVLNDIGLTVVEVIPKEDDATDLCDPGGRDVSGGIDLGNNQYMLVNDGVEKSGLEEEAYNTIVPNILKISINYNTAPNLSGECRAGVVVIQPYLTGTLTYVLGKTVGVQLPSVPLPMGKIHTKGFWDTADGAEVEVAATPAYAYAVVSPNPKLQLIGLASHSDGMDWGDYGLFWYSLDGADISASKHTIPEPKTAVSVEFVDDVPFTEGDTEGHTWCYHGEYVDGGPGKNDHRGHKSTCSSVTVTAPAAPELDAFSMPDICASYFSVDAQRQFQWQDAAYVTPRDGTFEGKAINIRMSKWLSWCQPAFPHVCAFYRQPSVQLEFAQNDKLPMIVPSGPLVGRTLYIDRDLWRQPCVIQPL